MFSIPETAALIFAARVIDRERQRDHALEVVQSRDLDLRLMPFIPLPPRKRRMRAEYERLLSMLQEVSLMSEPERSKLIEEISIVVAADKLRAR